MIMTDASPKQKIDHWGLALRRVTLSYTEWHYTEGPHININNELGQLSGSTGQAKYVDKYNFHKSLMKYWNTD